VPRREALGSTPMSRAGALVDRALRFIARNPLAPVVKSPGFIDGTATGSGDLIRPLCLASGRSGRA
jgi:hypothetical protein